MENCVNIGFSDSSSYLVVGDRNVGGLIGNVMDVKSLKRSGVISGKVSDSSIVSAVIGSYQDQDLPNLFEISEVYSKPQVTVFCTNYCSGFIGTIYLNYNSNFNISNCYSRASINSTGGPISGFIAVINITASIPNFNIIDSYCSNNINPVENASLSIGFITQNAKPLNGVNYVYNFDTNPALPGIIQIASFSFYYATLDVRKNCSDLLNTIQTKFNSSIWSGANLLSEYDFNANLLCDLPSTLPPSTLTPSTQTPSSSIPSSQIPSTSLPSTSPPSSQVPSTNFPSNSVASSQIPSTSLPSTSLPSSETPSTSLPSTSVASSQTPSNFLPSTLPPSTLTPSTQIPSSSIPSSQIPSTSLPSTAQNCVFNVANCALCDPLISPFNVIGLNVSCVSKDNDWVWEFTNSSSNSFKLSSDLKITKQILINSEFVLSKGNSISFDFTTSARFTTSSPSIVVDGCSTIEGELNILVDNKPSQQTSYDLISYNCPQSISLSEEQIKISTKNNNQNSCLKKNVNISPSTLSVTISPCERNLGLIIGLSVGLPIFCLGVFLVFFFVAKAKRKRADKEFHENQMKIEMENMKN